MDIFLDILLKPPQPLMGLFFIARPLQNCIQATQKPMEEFFVKEDNVCVGIGGESYGMGIKCLWVELSLQ